MPLEVRAYQSAILTEPHPWDDACDRAGHVNAYCLAGFEQTFRGLKVFRCYRTSGKRFTLKAGTYSDYGRFRWALSQAALGVEIATVWEEPEYYRDSRFFELLNFPDHVGCVGPEAAADLAADFDAGLEDGTRDRLEDGAYQDSYDYWSRALHLAASHGLVEFNSGRGRDQPRPIGRREPSIAE